MNDRYRQKQAAHLSRYGLSSEQIKAIVLKNVPDKRRVNVMSWTIGWLIGIIVVIGVYAAWRWYKVR